MHINTNTTKNRILQHKWLLGMSAELAAVFLIGIVGLSHYLVHRDDQYVLAAGSSHHERVGIVLGAGITKDGKPFPALQARLDTAATAISNGQVDKLLLSGDNRFMKYNEPDAMVNYLATVKHIPRDKLQPDYAGRSTYESCERAARVFRLDRAIIISAPSHLPRAIYLCRHFGIAAYGLSSGVDANNSTRRELQANVKAVFNIYIYGERTVLGAPIKM